MYYEDRYKSYIEQIPIDIQNGNKLGKYHLFGYTSNLDIILQWDAKIFNNLIEKYLKSDFSFTEGQEIDSLETLTRIVGYHAINGKGGEVEIKNIDICNFLEENFKFEPFIGGTCAQGAAALNKAGFPVIVHFTDKSYEICSLIESDTFLTINQNGLVPIKKVGNSQEPCKHIIFQFEKGDILKAFDKEYIIPDTNRIILDYDNIHKFLPIDKEFLDYCMKNSEKFYSYDISGFNLLIDEAILDERLDHLCHHYYIMKKNNPDCILYVEGAYYLSNKNKKKVFARISPFVDIVGMNEEELVDFTELLGSTANKENLESIIKGLELILREYSIKGLVMHTKDYSMYYGAELKSVDIEKGLTLGNIMSGTKARLGYYGTCQDFLDSLSLNLSPLGLDFCEKLSLMNLTRKAYLVPSRYMEHPTSTIGLGDTFVAGMQICFAIGGDKFE